jgi:hypothetical protein
VRVVRCEHKVPCVGYAFAQRARALRPEFAQLRQSLMGQGRGEGKWEQAATMPPGNVLLWVHPASHLPEQHQHGRSEPR